MAGPPLRVFCGQRTSWVRVGHLSASWMSRCMWAAPSSSRARCWSAAMVRRAVAGAHASPAKKRNLWQSPPQTCPANHNRPMTSSQAATGAAGGEAAAAGGEAAAAGGEAAAARRTGDSVCGRSYNLAVEHLATSQSARRQPAGRDGRVTLRHAGAAEGEVRAWRRRPARDGRRHPAAAGAAGTGRQRSGRRQPQWLET